MPVLYVYIYICTGRNVIFFFGERVKCTRARELHVVNIGRVLTLFRKQRASGFPTLFLMQINSAGVKHSKR